MLPQAIKPSYFISRLACQSIFASLLPIHYLVSLMHCFAYTTRCGATCSPNVCKTERVYEKQTYSYSYSSQRRCPPWFSCQSRLVCRSTGNCDGDAVNTTRTRYDCCEGFSRDPSVSTSYVYSLRRKNGCPLSKCMAVFSARSLCVTTPTRTSPLSI